MTLVHPHNYCRICDTALGEPYLDLGCQPLANALIGPAFNPQHEFAAPLQIVLCQNCGLSQLTVVVDPNVLYSGYRFRSGATRAWVAHCEDLARQSTEIFKRPGWVLDIAANDGTQLAAFYERGWETIGVEPADIPPVRYTGRLERAFWNIELARKLRDQHQAMDLVVAQNVLGHVDDPVAFLTAVEHVLAPDGLCAIEVPHVRDMILAGEFDTIYHEHLSYWNTSALIRCARKANLALHRVENLKTIHGGSRRYWLKRSGGRAENDHPAFELPIDPMPYRRFANEVERKLTQVQRTLEKVRAERKVIAAWGASAKGTVMLNALKARGNTVWPCAIIDDCPEKQGLLSPGVHIPILSPSSIDHVDVLWLLSWNWREPLKARAREYGFKGQFLLTSPQVVMES